MIAALCLCVALQDSNLQKVVPTWTGKNGYEEYVKAAMILDRADSREFDEYVRFRENPAQWKANSTHPDKEPSRPAAVPENADLLGVYEAESRQFGPVLDLIRQGTQKQVHYPLAQITNVTLMPELSLFKRAARLFAHLAYVEFGEGKNAQGAEAILDGLEFSKRIRVCGLIHLLVGIACEGTELDAVQIHLGQLSLDDARRLRKWVDAQSGQADQMASAAEMDRKSYRADFDAYFRDPKPYLGDDVPAPSLAAIEDFVKHATDKEKDSLYAATLKRYEPYFAAIAARAKQPESEWFAPLKYEDRAASPPEFGLGGTLALMSLMAVVQNLSGGGNDMFPSVVERSFIKERLLGATCDVVQYKWLNGKLPPTLAEACGKRSVDPATGQAYLFQPLPDGTFKLVCHAPALGDVTISSKR